MTLQIFTGNSQKSKSIRNIDTFPVLFIFEESQAMIDSNLIQMSSLVFSVYTMCTPVCKTERV